MTTGSGIRTVGELVDCLTKFNRDTPISTFEITFQAPDSPHELAWGPR